MSPLLMAIWVRGGGLFSCWPHPRRSLRAPPPSPGGFTSGIGPIRCWQEHLDGDAPYLQWGLLLWHDMPPSLSPPGGGISPPTYIIPSAHSGAFPLPSWRYYDRHGHRLVLEKALEPHRALYPGGVRLAFLHVYCKMPPSPRDVMAAFPVIYGAIFSLNLV